MMQKRQVEIQSQPGEASQQRDKLMNKLVQYAMNFANDSFHTSLCVQYPSSRIAQACVFLAGQFAKAKADWATVLDVSDVESFASICVQLVELVSEKKGGDKTAFQEMRIEIERVRRAVNSRNAAKAASASKKSPPRSPPPPAPDSKRQRIG
mmetsp:Transcript_34220/g.78921  ORF Transcript_34220/g.78921 Transcript_34220/m.78921 type:complete len:152 (-) Transcript_34220:959-1414(-)